MNLPICEIPNRPLLTALRSLIEAQDLEACTIGEQNVERRFQNLNGRTRRRRQVQLPALFRPRPCAERLLAETLVVRRPWNASVQNQPNRILFDRLVMTKQWLG